MMKTGYAALIVFLFISCSDGNAKVKGKLSRYGGQKLYFEEIGVAGSTIVDSTILHKNGSFRFSDEVKYPTFFQLRLKNKGPIMLLLEPGEIVFILSDSTGLVDDLTIEGSKGSSLVNSLTSRLEKAQKKLKLIGDEYKAAGTDAIKDSLVKEYDRVLDNHRKYTIGFILANPGSLTSYMALFQQYDDQSYVLGRVRDLQFFKIVTDSLSVKYPRSKYVIALKKNTAKMMEDYTKRKLFSLAPKNDFSLPDIELPDPSGKQVRLSSLRGNYIMLNFWASSNKPSVAYNLQLKEVYNRFKNKGFKVYSVSLDNSTKTWKQTIWFDELKWTNVIDTSYPGSVAAGTYNVRRLPASYLIAPDYESIIAKDIAPAQLNEKLKELLK